MKLYSYWRSSASWRVRIALALKGIEVEQVPVDLLEGANHSAPHVSRSPMAQVPVLELEDGTNLTQSMAILDYLEHIRPTPRLFPANPVDRAHVFALAEIVNSGIQPLQNLSVLNGIVAVGGDRSVWGRTVIDRGLLALQKAAAPRAGAHLFGDTPTAADVFLVPQLYNARRFGCDLDALTLLTEVEARCEALPAFQSAHPDQQPDARTA